MKATRCNQHGRVTGTYRKDAATKSTIMRLKGRDKPVRHDEDLGVNHFPARLQDSRGHFWAYADDLREFDGTRIIDHGNDNPFFFRKIPGVGIYNRTIKTVAEDSKGRTWASTSSGLMRYSGRGTKWDWVGGRFDGMLGMMGWHVVSNGRDIISYAGTWNYLTTNDGLACDSCWGIWCDDDETMWFTSQAGAQSLDLESFRGK